MNREELKEFHYQRHLKEERAFREALADDRGVPVKAIDLSCELNPFDIGSFGFETWEEAFLEGYKQAYGIYQVCGFCEYSMNNCECKKSDKQI